MSAREDAIAAAAEALGHLGEDTNEERAKVVLDEVLPHGTVPIPADLLSRLIASAVVWAPRHRVVQDEIDRATALLDKWGER